MSWVEVNGAGWSWVELGARFSYTQMKLAHVNTTIISKLFLDPLHRFETSSRLFYDFDKITI